jgi:hypothetical protein
MVLRETLIFMQKACPTRQYEAGVLEQWGAIGDIRKFLGLHNTPVLHYSVTPGEETVFLKIGHCSRNQSHLPSSPVCLTHLR